MDRLPITEAALRLGLSYQQVRTRILTGHLAGGRDEFGKLYVDAAAVEQLRLDLGAEDVGVGGEDG